MIVNRWKDFLDRVGWTAIQAAAGAALTALTDPHISWGAAAKFVGTAAAVAALKVILAQQASRNADGAAIPGGVLEPGPAPPPVHVVAVSAAKAKPKPKAKKKPPAVKP